MINKPWQAAGKTLRQAREALGKTRAEVASAIGCSRQDINNWENGYVAVTRKRRSSLATAYGISDSELEGLYNPVNGMKVPTPSIISKNILPLLKAIVKSGRESVTMADLTFLTEISSQLGNMPESLVRELLENRLS